MNTTTKPNIITKLLCGLMAAIFGYLFIVSLFSTVYVSELEKVFYIKDKALINVITLAVFLAVCFVLRGFIINILDGKAFSADSSMEKRIPHLIIFNTVITGLVLLSFIIKTQFYPLYDQAKVLNTVKELFVYDYSDFLPGGYMDRCGLQWGLMLYFYGISKVVGHISIAAIQILNVAYVLIANYLAYKISDKLFGKITAAIIHIALCLYIPQWFYTTFVYGTIPSYMFSLLAIYLFVELVHADAEPLCDCASGVGDTSVPSHNIRPTQFTILRKIIYAALMGISMSIAIIFKTNSLIMMIGLILLSIYFMIAKKNLKYIGCIASLIVFWLIGSALVNNSVRAMIQLECGGIPKTSYIAMGLMENSDIGPGWYNGYNDEVYENNNFDTDAANAEATEKISELLNGFKSNPANLVSFVSRKIVSQWNEPTYESLYIMYGRDSIPGMSPFVREIVNPTTRVNASIRELFNKIQLIVIFGVFIYFILGINTINMEKLIPAVMVLGGFFFHLMWEAKSQYIFTYFLLLIPYAVAGVNKFICAVRNLGKSHEYDTGRYETSEHETDEYKSREHETAEYGRKRIVDTNNRGHVFIHPVIIVSIALLIICALVAIVPAGSNLGKLTKPQWRTAEYEDVTNPEINPYVPAGRLDKTYAAALWIPKYEKVGRYVISVVNRDGYLASNDSEDSRAINGREVIIFTNGTSDFVRFQDTQLVLDMNMGEVKEGNTLQTWEFNGDPGQQYIFLPTKDTGDSNPRQLSDTDTQLHPDETYNIYCGDLAVGTNERGELVLVKPESASAIEVKLERSPR